MRINFKLTTRILLGYLIPMSAVLVAGITVYQKSSEVQVALQRVEASKGIVDLGSTLELYGARLQAVTRGTLIEPTEARYRDYDVIKASIKQAIGQLMDRVNDPQQQKTLLELERVTQQIETATQTQIDLVKQNRVSDARDLFRQSGSGQYFKEFSRLHAAFFKRESEIQTQRAVAAKLAASDMTATSWQAVLLVLLLSLVSAWLLSRQIGRRIRNITSTIASSTNEIVATTAEHERSMEEQASAVAETSSTIEEVITTAKSNSEQAQLVTDSAREAQETVTTGLELSDKNRREMADLESSMKQFSEQISTLSNQATQIGDIARVVSELAAQTNMLALNAAVEASRAGEQGKGFAVVASEIRKLADQSKKSAINATDIVADIQQATTRMVDAAGKSSNVTHEATNSVQEVVVALERVKVLSETVHISAQQVQLNSTQQASALSQVGGAMASINDGAHAMAAGTIQIRTGMERLANATTELNTMV